jgi:hypothetical protein
VQDPNQVELAHATRAVETAGRTPGRGTTKARITSAVACNEPQQANDPRAQMKSSPIVEPSIRTLRGYDALPA